jgi:DNA-binding YbaB/EbfC family protein
MADEEDEVFSSGGLGDFSTEELGDSSTGEPGDSSAGGLGDLFSQLQAARAELEAQAEAIEATVVEGSAAGGAVVVRLTGSLEAESVHIDPSIINPADAALLEDAVLAALRDALGRIIALQSSVQPPGDPPFAGGIDLGDLGNLVGNLDLEGLLGGVDLESLMGNLGMGLDLGALGGLRALDDDDDFEDDDDQRDEPGA